MDTFNKKINSLHIAISYSITNEENAMDIAKIWIDTNEKVKLNRDTKAVTKLLDCYFEFDLDTVVIQYIIIVRKNIYKYN